MAARQISQYDATQALGVLPAQNLNGADASGSVVTAPNGLTQSLQSWMGDLQAIAVAAVVGGYINGFTLSNDPALPTSVVDVAAGFAADSTNATIINGSAFAKSTSAAWTAGTTASGMGVSLTIAPSTWYHVFAIIVGGAFDVYFDTSLTAANAPGGTTAYRYIGSFLTDASAHVLPFVQRGQKVLWGLQRQDLASGAATALSAVTLSAPLGLVTFPILMASVATSSGGNASLYPGGSTIAEGRASGGYGQMQVTTDVASRISYSVSDGATTLSLYTVGYLNPHLSPVI